MTPQLFHLRPFVSVPKKGTKPVLLKGEENLLNANRYRELWVFISY